jgi:DNA adenine methylase
VGDPENGGRFTVKKYHSAKTVSEDAWQHDRIELLPLNPDYEPISSPPTKARKWWWSANGCISNPMPGGAGAALTLLERNVVDEIHINDADPRVFAFWNAVLNETEHLPTDVLKVPLDMDEWRRQRQVCSSPAAHGAFDVGFSAFYMNRCNRSGVLTGAGPIGGLQQTGKWKLDARFSREALAQRIRQVGAKRDRIHLSGKDAIEFLKSSLPSGQARRKVFVYLDPPYVNNGQRLYLNAYKPKTIRRSPATYPRKKFCLG